MSQEDQMRMERMFASDRQFKGQPNALPGGNVPDTDAGPLGTLAAYGVALTTGALSDMAGSVPAGVVGAAGLTIEALTNTAGTDGGPFWGRENVSGAGKAVEDISMLWNEHVTKPWFMDPFLPESVEDDGEEAHQNIQTIMATGLDWVAMGAHVVTSPQKMALEAAGVDTIGFEAAVDAWARGTATAAMLALGYRPVHSFSLRSKGQKPQGRSGEFTAEEMNQILGDAAADAGERFIIDPERLAAASRMPDFDQYQAGKRSMQGNVRPPPEMPPRQEGLPGMEPQPLQTPRDLNTGPQGELPFGDNTLKPGAPPQTPKPKQPMTEAPYLEGEWLPKDAPIQPMGFERFRNIIEGKVVPETLALADQRPRNRAGQLFKGKGIPAEEFNWRQSKEVRAGKRAGIEPFPKEVVEATVLDLGEKLAAKVQKDKPAPKAPKTKKKTKAEKVVADKRTDDFNVLIGGIMMKTRAKGKSRIGKFSWKEVMTALKEAGVPERTLKDSSLHDGITDFIKTQKHLAKDGTYKKRSDEILPGTVEEMPTAKVRKEPPAKNGIPADFSHIPLKDIEFLSMKELRGIAASMKSQGMSARGKPIAGRSKQVLAQKIREAAASDHIQEVNVAKSTKDAYEAYTADINEMNATIAKETLADSGALMHPDMAALLRDKSAEFLRLRQIDRAGLVKAGVPEADIVNVMGGLAKLRTAAQLANETNFNSAGGKLFQNEAVQAVVKTMPPELQAVVAQLAVKMGKTQKLGEAVDMFTEVEMGKTLETPSLILPKSKGASPFIAKFTVNELIALYREMLTAKPGIWVPGKGTLTEMKTGFDSLTAQAFSKWGKPAHKAQEGLVSGRGEFYTPAEMSALKQLIDTARHDFPALTVTEKIGMDTAADAVAAFRIDVSPSARAASGRNRKYTLADHGITVRDQPGFRGKPGEMGYFNLEAFNLLDPVRRKWKGASQARKRKKGSRETRSAYKSKSGKEGINYTGAQVTKQDISFGSFAREYLFGGKVIGGIQRRAVELAEQGKFELMNLAQMLDQIPQAYVRRGMKNVQSFYQLHTKAFADLIADSGNGVSLAAVLKPFQGKYLTGPRRYMGYIPGIGLTLQRLKPQMIKDAFLDMTSGLDALTPLGQALRKYADYVYDYGKNNGMEMATYVRNWYPVILRGFSKKDRAAFTALVESKAKSPQQRARMRDQADHIMELAFENGGLITADAKPGLNGRHINAEMRRVFFDRFTMEELRPFIINDPARALYSYSKGVARRVANQARWGKNEVVWKQQLEAATMEAAEAGTPLSKADIATLEAGRQILAHTYQTAPPWYVGAMRWGVAWQNAAKLGLVLVGSLAEIGVGLLNPTFQKHYAKAIFSQGFRGVFQNTARAINRDVPQLRGRRLAEAIGRSVDVEMHDVLTATHAADLQSVGSNIVFQLNGLHALTNMLQDINVHAFEGAMKQAVAQEFNVRLGRAKRSEMQMADADVLAHYGIDMEAAMHWYRDGQKMTGAFWDQQYAPALLKYLNDTVMTPRGVNMPRWMSNPWLTPVRHLMTYTSVFANTVLPNIWFQLKGGIHKDAPYSLLTRGKRSAKAFGGAASIFALGMFAEELLDMLKYGGPDEHPLRDKIKDDDQWEFNQALRYINRGGFFGLGFSKLFDGYEAFQYGRTDFGLMDGAMLTETAAAVEVLGLGLLAGEIDAKQAAKWIVRNTFPIHAATLPRDKKALFADQLPVRSDMEDDLADWLDDMIPGVGKKHRKKFKFSK